MKVVILAGGFGTRLSEETHLIPKPMVRIGDRPIIWHVMQCFASQGYSDFVVACGYKAEVIKRWFMDYRANVSDFKVDLGTGAVEFYQERAEQWRVTLVDTGLETMTGGRVGRLVDYLDSRFLLTYGDGLGNVDLKSLMSTHERSGAIATLTAVQPVARFGRLELEGDMVTSFQEKPHDEGGLINGGFMVVEPEIFKFIDGDSSILESQVLPRVADVGRLACHVHRGFWRPMDTLRDKEELDALAISGSEPWLVTNSAVAVSQ